MNAAVAGNYQHGDAKGFIVVHGRVQNPGPAQEFPNYTNLLFELQDGSQYQEPLAPIYRDPTAVQIPSTASSIEVMPKEAMNVAWVAANWNGVPPTKFFFQDNGSCQAGQVNFTRIIFGKHDVKIHAL